jgi:hypothetical protein
MALVRLNYKSRRSGIGPAKRHEQNGDHVGMVEALTKVAESWGDMDEASRLRASLRPQPISKIPETQPAMYTEPAPEKPVRKRRRMQPAPSPDKKLRDAWREVDAKRGRTP